MTHKFRSRLTIVIILLAIVLFFACVSYKSNPKDFFDIKITNMITFIVAIYFTYYLSERNVDERIQKQIITELIKDIQSLVNIDVDKLFSHESDTYEIRNHQRRLTNKISTLCKFCENLDFCEDKEYLEGQLRDFKTIVDDKQDDRQYLIGGKPKIKKIFSNVDQFCDDLGYRLFSECCK